MKEPQKFWLTMPCPVCSDSGFTWIVDNGDGCMYDGDTFTCDNCKATGDVVAFEDGSFDLCEPDPDEPSPTETEEKR